MQVKDADGGEHDRLDEAICPTDMNLICDDDLRAILWKLPPTVSFTMISDCCHSGSMLDHPEQQIAGDKATSGPPGLAAARDLDASELVGKFFGGAGVRGYLARLVLSCLHAPRLRRRPLRCEYDNVK
jgi:hypothetical protein